MRLVRIILRVLTVVVLGGFFHYVLPQHDIGKVTSTEVIRTDFSGFNRLFYAQADSGNLDQPTRDLRLINTEIQRTFLLGFVPRDATRVMVYRNEDSGWIWPPYFKFDSSDLQAMASANISSGATEKWVKITHYGWRNRFFTIYPNAVGITPIAGPDVRIIPWFNIVFFVILIAAGLFLRAAWRQFRERTMDPALDKASDAWDEVGAGVAERRSRFGRWLDSWRGRK